MSRPVPTWQADSALSKCYLCKAAFTLFNRRHHCRKCGQLVCAPCSAKEVRYFKNSYVLNAQNTPEKARSHAYYRTCDVCADEIQMIRDTLSSQRHSERTRVSQGAAGEDLAIEGLAIDPHVIPDSRTAAGKLNLATGTLQGISMEHTISTGSERPSNSDSDAELCPVCGIDLWQEFANEPPGAQTAYEPYKEGHVSQCLVTYDFASDHLRLSSPPGGLQTRNRMLVYNMPPIPEPSYETITNNLGGSGAVTSRENENGELTGNADSSATFLGTEKSDIDTECVICLENLCPGDKVGRLECLCVFHYKCIKDWFNKKSYAECPVHFLHS